MFDLDKWMEIFEVLRKNKLRTFLTAFSVAWGIFMLIMLLGFGNGIQRGVQQEFQRDAVNSIWVNSGKTSLPYNGMQPGRQIRFTNDDYELIRNTISGVENVTSRNHIWTPGNITYKDESSSFSVLSCHPGYMYLENLVLTSGRFINETDVKESRKVAVLGSLVVDQLFKVDEPLGKYITIKGMPFLVIGTFKDQGGDWDQRRLYIPISTGQKLFDQVNYVQQISMNTLSMDVEEAEEKEKIIHAMLAEKHNVSPDDVAGIRIRNSLHEFVMYNDLFLYIRIFVWAVGVLTVIAGIVGVGNIMTISVRERTKEIGIRKAIGATPFSVVSMIMQEAVLITIFAGYFGLIAGVGLLEALNYFVQQFNADMGFFREPGVDFSTALLATGLLVLAGTIAGLIPAIKAANISPIAAIREE